MAFDDVVSALYNHMIQPGAAQEVRCGGGQAERVYRPAGAVIQSDNTESVIVQSITVNCDMSAPDELDGDRLAAIRDILGPSPEISHH